ncbi:MAG: hypothetical protein HFI86_00380 [Bacilli bacterium]|nr:hypothetical protein [Bacilli bacterium]
MENWIIKVINILKNQVIGIHIHKEPIIINETQLTYENDNQKAEIIAMETGIPIKYIYEYIGNNYTNNWIKIDGKWFFIKKTNKYLKFFNELLGQEISNYFKLETVNYKIAKKFENYYFANCLLSENFFDNNYNYLIFEDLRINTINKTLNERLNLIKEICQKYNDKNYLLLEDIIKMSIRDLYSNMCDRHNLNFFFKTNDNGIRLAPLFDYEHSFMTPPNLYTNPLLRLAIYEKDTCELVKQNDTFQESIYRLMDINIEKLLEITQDKNGISISDGLKNIFINHDRNAKNTVKSFYLRK